MRACDLMTPVVFTTHPESSLCDAACCMWEHNCGAVPVLDEHNAVVGILTDRDICLAAYTQGNRIADIRVDTVMASAPPVCRSTDSLATVLEKMRQCEARKLPVLDAAGRLVGIVSLSDIARDALDMREVALALAELHDPPRWVTRAAQ